MIKKIISPKYLNSRHKGLKRTFTGFRLSQFGVWRISVWAIVRLWSGGYHFWPQFERWQDDFTFEWGSAALSRISRLAIVQLQFGGFHFWILVGCGSGDLIFGHSSAAVRKISLLTAGRPFYFIEEFTCGCIAAAVRRSSFLHSGQLWLRGSYCWLWLGRFHLWLMVGQAVEDFTFGSSPAVVRRFSVLGSGRLQSRGLRFWAIFRLQLGRSHF